MQQGYFYEILVGNSNFEEGWEEELMLAKFCTSGYYNATNIITLERTNNLDFWVVVLRCCFTNLLFTYWVFV